MIWQYVAAIVLGLLAGILASIPVALLVLRVARGRL